MDLVQFFGRFHVLVLHLPIGILMLAALMEIYTNVKNLKRNELLDWVWFWGAISAFAASVLGWLLSQGDGYTAQAVFIHRSFGISVVVIAVISWWFFKTQANYKGIGNSLAILQLFVLFATGHYGANMTHGETYLIDTAPNIIRIAAGFEPHPEPRPPIATLKEAYVYEDVIAPILQKRCTSCHNDAKQKGKLNLANVEGILKGGRTGKAVVAGDLSHSELYTRITLDSHDEEFMPAEGKTPLTDEQVKTIAWWINAGVPTTGSMSEYKITKEDKKALQHVLGLTPSEFYLPPIETISKQQYQELTQAGFVVKQIAQHMNYLDLDYSSTTSSMSNEALQLLLEIREHIVYLNLRGSVLSDSQVQSLVHFNNLQRLRLENTRVDDNAIAALTTLKNLKYLNIYNTQVTKNVLNNLKHFPALQRVFLGEVNISQDLMASFRAETGIELYAIASKETAQTNTNESVEASPAN